MIVPKVELPGDLAFVERLLDGTEAVSKRRDPLRVQALVETAAGLSAVDDIAGASPRLEGLVLGYADLAVSLGRSRAGVADLDRWGPARERIPVAARAHGLLAIDGPHLAVDDGPEFAASAARAAQSGWDDKWAIHPRRVAAIDEHLHLRGGRRRVGPRRSRSAADGQARGARSRGA